MVVPAFFYVRLTDSTEVKTALLLKFMKYIKCFRTIKYSLEHNCQRNVSLITLQLSHVIWTVLIQWPLHTHSEDWQHFIWYDIWYDMIRYDNDIWYDTIWLIWYMIWYDMIYDMMWYDMIYDMIWYMVFENLGPPLSNVCRSFIYMYSSGNVDVRNWVNIF
jgi:hypothetical protein